LIVRASSRVRKGHTNTHIIGRQKLELRHDLLEEVDDLLLLGVCCVARWVERAVACAVLVPLVLPVIVISNDIRL